MKKSNAKSFIGKKVKVIVDQPLEIYEGLCIGYIVRADDDDDKLIIVPEGLTFSNAENPRESKFSGKVLQKPDCSFLIKPCDLKCTEY